MKITSALQDMSEAFKDEFNRLDGTQGDGDLGVTVDLVTKAVHQSALETSDIQSWLKRSGTLVRKQAPSTMGVLLSFALSAAVKALMDKDPTSPSVWADTQLIMVEEIKKRGEATVGDRTVLDAFIPAVEAFRNEIDGNGNFQSALLKAKEAALSGAESTKNLVPKTGRASWVGERAVGEVDGGAWYCFKVYETLSQVIGQETSREEF